LNEHDRRHRRPTTTGHIRPNFTEPAETPKCQRSGTAVGLSANQAPARPNAAAIGTISNTSILAPIRPSMYVYANPVGVRNGVRSRRAAAQDQVGARTPALGRVAPAVRLPAT